MFRRGGILASAGVFARLVMASGVTMAAIECMARIRFGFHPRRVVDVSADAPATSSDAGLVLLRQLDEQLGLCGRLAPPLVDGRAPRLTQPTPLEAPPHRVFQNLMVYDGHDHATALRRDR